MEAEISVVSLALLHRKSLTFMASTRENDSDHRRHQCSEGFLSFFLLNREEMREELIFVGIQREGLQEFQANAIDV